MIKNFKSVHFSKFFFPKPTSPFKKIYQAHVVAPTGKFTPLRSEQNPPRKKWTRAHTLALKSLWKNLKVLSNCCDSGWIHRFKNAPEDKTSTCSAGDWGSLPGLGRFPGEGNGNLLQYSCLENPMDRGAWWATVRRVAKSQTWLSDFTFTSLLYI